MKLKRHYNTPKDWVKKVDESGTCINPPPLSHLEVKHTGTSPDQHFSPRLVAAGLSEGWMSIKEGVLTLHATPEDLHYTILRMPGRYPSKTEKSGYEVINYYDCVLDEAQHDAHRVQKGQV